MEKQIIELTKKAVSIQSTSNNVENLKKIITLFANIFHDSSIFEVKHFMNNGKPSALIKPKRKEPKVWFNAHLDVVPGDNKLFSPIIKDSKLFGRGALDMKTAAACLTYVAKKLIMSGENIGLMLVTDEEIGGHNGTKFLIENNLVKPEFVIVGESTNLEIGIESKGVIALEVISKGKSAHGSRPWLGKNAFVEMINPIQKLLSSFPIPDIEVWETTVNIGTVQAGNAVNQVPDRCVLKLDIRYIPQDSPQHIIRQIKRIFKHQKVVVKMMEPPIFTDEKNNFVELFSKSLRETLNKKPIFRKGHGSADIRFFTEKEIPAIAFGLKGKGLHADNEWVSLKEVGKYITILEDFVISVK